MLLLDYLRSTRIYELLAANDECGPEGNLLQITDERTAESQVSFIIWAFSLARPSNILEIGHNRGMFSYLVSILVPEAFVLALDINPAAYRSTEVLTELASLDIEFLDGDSKESLEAFVKYSHNRTDMFDFAWVDGGHDYPECYSDLMNCSRLNIPYVAVDDTNYDSVMRALSVWTRTEPYEEVPNPFIGSDSRQARLFKKV